MNKIRGARFVRAEASPQDAVVKQLYAEFKQTFADFQKANDERLAAIEAGKADILNEEKVERINAAVSDIQDRLDTAIKDLAALQVGGGGADPAARAKLEGEVRAFLSGMKGSDIGRISPEDVDSYQAYANVFASFLRRGISPSRSDVQAAMSVGSDPDGGYWVPKQMESTILTRLFETSPMRQVSDVMSITGDSVEWPNDTNDATSGGWVGEYEDRSETATPQVGTQTIYVREQYAMPIVTQKLLDMANVDVEGWLAGKIADKLSRTENTAFVTGTGVNQPRGFLDYSSAASATADASRAWGVLEQVVSGAAADIPYLSGSTIASDPDCLITLISKLKPAYRAGAVWMMSRATEARLRKMKDIDGNYLVAPVTGPVTGFSLFGFPIVTAEDMPAIAANAYPIAFGNFRVGYQIVDGRGLRVLRDNLTTKGRVKFYTTKWTGGDVINFDAIKLLKMSA